MHALATKRCLPCERGKDPLSKDEADRYLASLEGWSMHEGKQISKEYVFKDFPGALRFINEVGAIAEVEGHHPDLFLHEWNRVNITLSTHVISGLHLNDFILASKIDVMKNERFESGTSS